MMILGMQQSRLMLQEIDTQKQQLWKRSIPSAFDSRIRRPFPAVALHLSMAISCGRPLFSSKLMLRLAQNYSDVADFLSRFDHGIAMLNWQATGVQITSCQVYQGQQACDLGIFQQLFKVSPHLSPASSLVFG
jgi:hypothetical protein